MEKKLKEEESFKIGALIDLHNHIDGSISFKSARELAEMQGMPFVEEEELKKMMMVGPDCRSLTEFLTKFDYPCSLLQTKSSITKCVNNLIKELKEGGLIYAELRFAPQRSLEKGLSMEEVVESAVAGLDAQIMPAGIILSCMRGEGEENERLNRETVEMGKKFLGKGVVCVDLAGDESHFPTENFEGLLTYAKELGVPFIVHCGEAEKSDTGIHGMKTAIRLGTSRIGHGVLSNKHPEFLKELAEKKVPLELCPTSNLCTEIFPNIESYPLRKFMEAGVKFCINTDDMTVEGIDLMHEYELVRSTFNLSKEEVKQILLTAVEISFATKELKKKLCEQVEEFYK